MDPSVSTALLSLFFFDFIPSSRRNQTHTHTHAIFSLTHRQSVTSSHQFKNLSSVQELMEVICCRSANSSHKDPIRFSYCPILFSFAVIEGTVDFSEPFDQLFIAFDFLTWYSLHFFRNATGLVCLCFFEAESAFLLISHRSMFDTRPSRRYILAERKRKRESGLHYLFFLLLDG